MVYDPARAKTVLFGGFNAMSGSLNDTWEYNGATATWTLITTTGSPPARSGHAMVYDNARGRIVLFGGYGSGYLNDTWEYDGATGTWTQITTTGSLPTRVIVIEGYGIEEHELSVGAPDDAHATPNRETRHGTLDGPQVVVNLLKGIVWRDSPGAWWFDHGCRLPQADSGKCAHAAGLGSRARREAPLAISRPRRRRTRHIAPPETSACSA